MDGRETMLASLLQTLMAEEAEIQALLVLALEEQDALIASDFTEISRVSSRMLSTARGLEDLERERARLLCSLGHEETTLDELVPVAEQAGIDGFSDTRLRLLATAARLREAQERNARLLLAAMKLQERWIAMFGALSAGTYAADGSQSAAPGRQYLSRSA